MKKRSKFFIISLGMLTLFAAAWLGLKFLTYKNQESSISSYAEITVGDIESVVTAQGKLEPKEYVDVGAQVSGQVKKLHADIGDTVKTGDLIAEIDPDVYNSQVAGDEARLKTLQAQKVQQQAQVVQAKQKLERNRILIKEKAISQEVFEDAQTAVKIAEAQLLSLDAQIEEAQSTLEGHKTSLSYTKIYAPIDGTIVSQPTKEGQTINANQTAPVIVQVANLDVMTVRAQVAEADISKLVTEMPVYFTIMGSQNRRWKATIRQILPSPETLNDVVLYNVLVDVDNKDRQLMTGMTTQVFFVLGSAKNVNLIPASVLQKHVAENDTAQGKAYEIKVLQNNKPASKIIIIGFADRTQAEVVSGLQAGDKILLPGIETKSSSATANSATSRRGGGMPRL